MNTKREPSQGDAAYQYWMEHRDEPGFSCHPKSRELEAFSKKLKRKIARVLKAKGIL